VEIRAFEPRDHDQVIALWRRCQLVRPTNDPARDIERKLKVQPHLFLVGVVDDQVIASVMAGYEGHRGWINYLAVDSSHQRRGYAGQMMAEAERLLRLEGCPKINLQVRTSNRAVIDFYRHIGFDLDDVVSLGKRLVGDAPSATSSTAAPPGSGT
jgi:ribosomal protein S18 acetylase RimI-like enzyme